MGVHAVKLLTLLIDHGANVNAVSSGWTLLHSAVGTTLVDVRADMIALLVRRGANVEAIDDKGRTPLQLAKECGCDEALCNLLG